MNRPLLILIALLSIAIISVINLSGNIYSQERYNEVTIEADRDFYEGFYLNPSHQMDFLFITDDSVFSFYLDGSLFKNNLTPYKITCLPELLYRPPLLI